jgi:hypothetical protein
MGRPKTTISDEVWRKGWRREAAATQAASAELAATISWLEQNGYGDIAKNVREIAMQHGARNAAVAFGGALRTLSLTTIASPSNGKRA